MKVVFVHGTGVREPRYSETLGLVIKQAKARSIDIEVIGSYWGSIGAKLLKGGASIPTYDTTRGAGAEDEAEYGMALWALLYQDPLFELRSLGASAHRIVADVPGQQPPGEVLQQKLDVYAPSPALVALLEPVGMAAAFARALDEMRADPDFTAIIQNAAEPISNYTAAVARAVVARAVVFDEVQADSEPQMTGSRLTGVLRDGIVGQMIADLGGGERTVGDWLKQRIGGLAKQFSTYEIRKRRHSMSDMVAGFSGDIIYYQTRGGAIREFIERSLIAADGPVVVIAHSLGGIAVVDLLVERIRKGAPLSQVKALITVGSQAPVVYELGCLTALKYGDSLPAAFPPWHNVYDLQDFLSYVAAPIFGGDRARDIPVNNRQPFPDSHSAYWTNPEFWAVVREVIASTVVPEVIA